MFIFINNDSIINCDYIVCASYYFEKETDEHLLKFVMSVTNTKSDKVFYRKFDSKEEAIGFLCSIK